MDEQRYVDIGDGNVYLVANDPMESFDVELSDLIKDDEIPDFEQVSSIAFTGAESYTVTYEEDSGKSYSADDVYFNQDGQPLDTSPVDSYLSSLTNADLSEYVTYNATEEELEKYGMNDPELTVAVDYTYTDEDDKEVSDSITVSIARAPGDGRTWMRWRRRVSPMIPAQMPLRTSLPTCGWASPRSFISSAATPSPP